MWFLYFIKWLICRCLACLFRLAAAFADRKDDGVRRVIVLRNDHIGDFVGSLPFFRGLHGYCRERGMRVVAAVAPASRELAAACRWIDEVEVVDQKRFRSVLSWLYQWRVVRWLARFRYELAINLISYDRVSHDDALLASLPAGSRWGILLQEGVRRRIPNKRWTFDSVYDRLFEFPGDVAVSVGEREFFGWLTGKDGGDWTLTELGIDEMPASRIEECGKAFAVVPGNSNPRQRWPLENFVAVADAMMDENPDWKCYLFGVASECGVCAEFVAKAKYPERVVNFCGKGSLLQLASDLKNVNLLVCNDSGAGHIAAAQGIRVVCILGGPHYGLFHPSPCYRRVDCVSRKMECFGCMGRCSRLVPGQVPYLCISEISVESVISVARQ